MNTGLMEVPIGWDFKYSKAMSAGKLSCRVSKLEGRTGYVTGDIAGGFSH